LVTFSVASMGGSSVATREVRPARTPPYVWRYAGSPLPARLIAALRVYGWSFYSQGTKDQMTSADAFISAALGWLGDPAPDAGRPGTRGSGWPSSSR